MSRITMIETRDATFNIRRRLRIIGYTVRAGKRLPLFRKPRKGK